MADQLDQSNRLAFRQFWTMFAKGYGRLPLAVFIGTLAVVTSLLEGLNVGLLVPLLENFEAQTPGEGHWISRGVASIFDTLGIPFTLGSVLVALSVVMLTLACLRYVRMVMTNKLQMGFTTWIRSKYMDTLLRGDLAHFHSERLGVMTDTLTIQSWAAGGMIFYLIEMITSFAVVVAYLIAAFLITPGLAGISLGLLLVVSVAMRRYVSKASAKASIQVERQNAFQVSAVESLSGVHVIKSFLLERVRSAEFGRRSEEVGDIHYDLFKNQSHMTLLQELTLFALVGAIVYVGVSVLDLGVAAIVALLFILFRLMPKVMTINNLRQMLAQALAAVRAVTVAMDRPSRPTIVSGNRPFTQLNAGIELEDVGFSYAASAEVLKSTCFNIEKGKMTAIVGASGAGKSTMIDLLLRHYDPVHGRILVDGVDLRELDLPSWRKNIGLVSQDVFLFNDSVAYNIGLDRPEISRDQIEEAAKQSYAHDFILELPKGYETEIGDRGWNLSGGQRQRLALARAIVGGPKILVLDEATSSLDSESEELIQQYMSRIRGTSTMIVVAHRTATIRDADKIVVLRDGNIVEEGDWTSLLQEEGVFARYQLLQSGG